MRHTLATGFALAFATSAVAQEPKVELKETFWQKVAGAGWVDFDPEFHPVFHLETGYYFAKTGTLVKYRDGKPAPAFFDRAGRAWVKDGDAVHLWTGTEWQTHPYKARHLFSATDGRVFLFDGTHVRVFDKDGKWTAQPISKTPRGDEKIDFLEHDNRVWAWLYDRPKYEQDIGAWSLKDGKWTHHTIANGFYFQSTHCLFPVADGRLIVFEYAPPGHGRGPPYYWHPDRKLAPDEMKVIPDRGVGGGGEVAYGTDGTLYFGHTPGGNSRWYAFDKKGAIDPLMKHVGLSGLPHAVVNGRRVVFHKLGDTPPVLPARVGEFVGADRAGRYYFAAHTVGWTSFGRGQVVTAIMPKHEKPGEVLRTEQDKLVVGGFVKDSAGKIWADQAAGGLVQWHAGKWIDTPVQSLYYPHWTARPMSPWSQWQWRSHQLFHLHGNSGSLLVVRIRDKYQLDDAPKDEERFPPRVINDPKFKHPAPPPALPKEGERPLYWLEARLFRDGKWTEPMEVRQLLETEYAAILKDFPATTSGGMSYFGLVNDGTRLWAAFDGKVLTIDKAGKLIEADWPLAKPKDPLPFVMLGRLADGKPFLAGPGGDFSLSLSPEGKVSAANFLLPGLTANTNEYSTHWKLAKDGTLWYWTATTIGNMRCAMWHLCDGKWTEKKGLGVPVHEDAAGDLWCVTEPRTFGKLLVVNGAATKELSFPEAETLGFTTVPKGASAWAIEDRLYVLDTGAKGETPVLRWRLLSDPVMGTVPATVDAKGTVLLGLRRGTLEK